MGSGGNNRAQAAAEQQERERQQQIAAGTAEVNRIYSDPAREAQIGDVLNATRQVFTQDLDRQKAETDRQLKFGMARSGLAGGSASASEGRKVGESYVRGRLEADRKAQGAAADLRLQDQASKQNLLAMIQSGLDMNTARIQASEGLRNNLASAKANATMGGLGDMFGAFGNLWTQSRENKARRDAEKYAYGTLYGTNKGGR